MRYTTYIFGSAIFVLSSFLNAKPIKTHFRLDRDTIKYIYHTIDQADAGINKIADSATVEIVYPVFTGQKALNEYIKRKLLDQYRPDKWKDTSYKQAIILFVRSYKEDKIVNALTPPYSLELSANVIFQDTGLIAVQCAEDAFDGGAHGNSLITFINWSTKENKDLALKDILISGYHEELVKVAEKIFRKQENLTDTASLSNNYFFDKGVFTLNNNFSITSQGLKFLYNNYEIKSYAEGTTELLVPYSQIKSLLKPNTVLMRYIK